MSDQEKIMEYLLYVQDFHVRCIDELRDDYSCGFADGVGQCILQIGEILGETGNRPYKFEAYKRAMELATVEQYKRDYPVPIERSDDV